MLKSVSIVFPGGVQRFITVCSKPAICGGKQRSLILIHAKPVLNIPQAFRRSKCFLGPPEPLLELFEIKLPTRHIQVSPPIATKPGMTQWNTAPRYVRRFPLWPRPVDRKIWKEGWTIFSGWNITGSTFSWSIVPCTYGYSLGLHSSHSEKARRSACLFFFQSLGKCQCWKAS